MGRMRRLQDLHFLFVLCKKCFRAKEEQMKDCCWPLLFSEWPHGLFWFYTECAEVLKCSTPDS